MHPFSTPFQWLEKGFIGNKWVKRCSSNALNLSSKAFENEFPHVLTKAVLLDGWWQKPKLRRVAVTFEELKEIV